MHSRVLIVVDMQNDFITGPLGNPECVSAVPEAADIIRNGGYDFIYVTADTHYEDYLSTQEGKNLPVRHCISGTEGWEIVPEIRNALDAAGNYRIIMKNTFGSAELGKILSRECFADSEADIIGVCTDICVVSNALIVKSMNPEMRITVISGACAGSSPEKHSAALETMRSCQIRAV